MFTNQAQKKAGNAGYSINNQNGGKHQELDSSVDLDMSN